MYRELLHFIVHLCCSFAVTLNNFCLSETYLDSTVASDANCEITGYNLVRSDHSASTKRGGVCL